MAAVITEVEYALEQIALAEALMKLRGLHRTFEQLYGEGSYASAVKALQGSLFPSQPPTESG